MKVKICGIQTVEEALTVEGAGADFIGFVFAPSKRQISLQQAAEISRSLKRVKKTGVFVNPTLEELTEAVERVPLDYIQLHGDESKELAEHFPGKIIKAFPSNTGLSYKEMFNFPAEYILIDSPRKEHYGGSGKVFDWSLLKDKEINKDRFILAGGLSPENIREAITEADPAVVDVSSGVETDGRKDSQKIKHFLNQVRSIENEKSLYRTK